MKKVDVGTYFVSLKDSEPEDDEDNELELETQKPEPGNQAKIKNDEDAYEKMVEINFINVENYVESLIF